MGSKLTYNEAFLQDVLLGRLTAEMTAQKHAISPRYLRLILTGRRCPGIMRQIDEMRQIANDEAFRMGSSYIKSVLAQELKVGIKGEDDPARKCREYVLDRFLPDEAPLPAYASRPPRRGELLPGLTAKALLRIGQAKGGPRPRRRGPNDQ